MSRDRETTVLDATYVCLSHYGMRRTTMEDIAREAGMSRSALYQYVRNKDDAVRRLAQRLHTDAGERAQAAAHTDEDWRDRAEAVLRVKIELVEQLTTGSPHTAELLDARTRLYGDICTAFTQRVHRLLVEVFTDGGVAHPTPEQAASICVALISGLESSPDQMHLLSPAVELLTDGMHAGRRNNRGNDRSRA